VRELADCVGEKKWLVCGLYLNEQQH
jgi:hypothetical protein